jgi:hypothetical protein
MAAGVGGWRYSEAEVHESLRLKDETKKPRLDGQVN